LSETKINWFKPVIEKKEIRELSKKNNLKGLLQFLGFFGILSVAASVAYLSSDTKYNIFIFLVYGQLYGFVYAAQHELMHKSVFESSFLNKAGLWVSCSLLCHEMIYNYYSHLQHHNYTLTEGRDIEGRPFNRPPNIFFDTLNLFFKYRDQFDHIKAILFHTLGKPSPNALLFVPKSHFREMYFNSRIHLLMEFGIISSSIIFQSWLPLLLITLPRFYGGLLHNLCSSAQHTGYPMNVYDHRCNTRTVIMNPVLRFFYWNMNYHIEHHLYPSVPFHALKKLHSEIKMQLPNPQKSLIEAWNEMIRCLVIQMKTPSHFIIPVLTEKPKLRHG